MHMKLSIVIGHKDRSFPERMVRQTATYLVGRSVKELNIAVEWVIIVSKQMLVMVRKVCSAHRSLLNAHVCLLEIAGMVYTAGCTDETYSSDRCPTKCGTGTTPLS